MTRGAPGLSSVGEKTRPISGGMLSIGNISAVTRAPRTLWGDHPP